MENEQHSKSRLDFLYKAIDDAQQIIRFTDAKAGAVIGFWTLLITLSFRSYSDFYLIFSSLDSSVDKWIVLLFVFILSYFFCSSLLMAYLTLVPKINPKEHIKSGSINIKEMFFLWETTPAISGKYLYSHQDELKLKVSIEDYHKIFSSFNSSDLEDSLIMELLKVSFIRNLKLTRTNAAITSVVNSLIVILFLVIFILGERVISFGGEINVDHLEVNVTLFILFYIGHKIADYLLQTDYQAVNKSKDWSALIIHCLVYTFTLNLMAFVIIGYFSWTAILLIFITHLIIDKGTFLRWWSLRIKKIADLSTPGAQRTMLELDQSFHYVVIFIVSLI